jgi:hypothetical protein
MRVKTTIMTVSSTTRKQLYRAKHNRDAPLHWVSVTPERAAGVQRILRFWAVLGSSKCVERDADSGEGRLVKVSREALG